MPLPSMCGCRTGTRPDEEIGTVVQPDLVVICDPAKIDERGCRGAPDLAVEILSPSTGSKDQVQKLGLYERHGVREYWVVDPVTRVIRVYLLGADGRYGRDVAYPAGAIVPVTTVPGSRSTAGLVFGELPAEPQQAGRRGPPGSDCRFALTAGSALATLAAMPPRGKLSQAEVQHAVDKIVKKYDEYATRFFKTSYPQDRL